MQVKKWCSLGEDNAQLWSPALTLLSLQPPKTREGYSKYQKKKSLRTFTNQHEEMRASRPLSANTPWYTGWLALTNSTP